MKKIFVSKTFIFICFMILIIASISIGVIQISLQDILSLNQEKMSILFLSRIPRSVSIIAAGFGMSISGLIMQQLTMNKFTSPTTVGTVEFAKLGVLISFLLLPATSIFAKLSITFLCALLGTLFFIILINRLKVKEAVFVPLLGMMLSSVVSAITTMIAYQSDFVQSVNAWLYGSFSTIMAGNYEMLYLIIPLILISYFYATKFTISGFGESFAINVGLNYRQVVFIGLSLVATITSIVITTIGSIPFMGLIIPNLVTMYFGEFTKKNIFITGMVGAMFLLLCDILSRIVIAPYELPITMIVGIIGSVIFLTMIVKRGRYA